MGHQSVYESHVIEVARFADFNFSEWRSAIRVFLESTWKGLPELQMHPEISFGDIALKLDSLGEKYRLTARSPTWRENIRLPDANHGGSRHVVSDPSRDKVHDGLAQFLLNPKISELVIHFSRQADGSTPKLILWVLEPNFRMCISVFAENIMEENSTKEYISQLR